MKITTEQLPQHLAQGLKPLYTVFGDETLLALEAGDRIRAAAREAGYTERVVLTVDSGFKWRDLALVIQQSTNFGRKRRLLSGHRASASFNMRRIAASSSRRALRSRE